MIDTFLLFKIISGGIASALLATGFGIIFKQYIQKRYRPSLYLSISWLGFFLEALLDTINLSIKTINGPSALFLRFSYLSLAPGFLGVLALVDSISRDGIEPRRFAIVIFLMGINTIVLLLPLDDFVLNVSYYLVISMGIVIGSYSFILQIKIYRSVPAGLKRAAMLNVLGAFSVSFLYVTVNVLEVTNPGVFPPISRLFEAAGALLQTIMFSKHEQLFYVLPFKTQRLIVYDTENGVTLFAHDWSKEGPVFAEDLFSGILQGMSMIVNESIQKGHVREIKMERGVLLINYDYTHPLAFVVIASKSSQVLNDGLAAFRRKFVQKFESFLAQKERTNSFDGAASLVTECFPFIPQFV